MTNLRAPYVRPVSYDPESWEVVLPRAEWSQAVLIRYTDDGRISITGLNVSMTEAEALQLQAGLRLAMQTYRGGTVRMEEK